MSKAGGPSRKLGTLLWALLGIGLALPLAVVAGLWWLQGETGKAWLGHGVNAAFGAEVHIGAIGGDLYHQVSLVAVELRDQDGVWARIPRIDIAWSPWPLLQRRLKIAVIDIPDASLLRLPRSGAKANDIQLPRLPLALDISSLRIARLHAPPDIKGEFTLDAALKLNRDAVGEVSILLQSADEAGDRLALRLDAGRRVAIDFRLDAPADGLIASLAGWTRPIGLRIIGAGPLSAWRGQLDLESAEQPVAKLELAIDRRNFRLDGGFDPSALLGKANRAQLGGAYSLHAQGAYQTRGVLEIEGDIEGKAGRLRANGGVRLRGALRFEDMGLTLNPSADGLAMATDQLQWRNPDISARLNGPIRHPKTSWRLRADQVRASGVSVEQLVLAGLVTSQGTRIHVDIDGGASRLVTGRPLIDRRLPGKLTLEVAFAIDQGAAEIENFTLTGPGTRLRLSGKAARDHFDLALAAEADDLTPLPVALAFAIKGSDPRHWRLDGLTLGDQNTAIKGKAGLDGDAFDADLAITSPHGKARLRARPADGATIAITLEGDSELGSLGGEAMLDPGARLARLDVRLANLRALGDIAIDGENQPVGDLELRLIKAPERLWGIAGDGKADLHLGPDGALHATLALNHLQRDALSAKGIAGTLRVTLDQASADIQIATLSTGRLKLERLAIKGAGSRDQGNLKIATGFAAAPDDQLELAGDWRGSEWIITPGGRLGGETLAAATPLRLVVDHRDVRLFPFVVTLGDRPFSGHFERIGDHIRADLAFSALPSAALVGLVGPLPGSATIDLAFALAKSASGRDGRVRLGLHDMRGMGAGPAIDAEINGVIDDQGLTATLAISGSEGQQAQGKASLGLAAPIQDQPLTAQLSGALDAGALFALLPIEGHVVRGVIDFNLDVAGSLATPSLEGQATIAAGYYENLDLGLRFDPLIVEATLDGLMVRFTRLDAGDGRGGRLTGDGEWQLGKTPQGKVALKLDKMRLIHDGTLSTTASGEVKLVQAANHTDITGNVAIDRGLFQLRDSAAEIPVIAVEEINLPPDRQAASTPEHLPRSSLDIRIKAPRRVLVEGKGLRSEWSGDLKLGGSIGKPTLVGKADIVRGEFDLAGRSFDLKRGALRFDGNTPPDPWLDIRAENRRTGFTAIVAVTGRASAPRFAFTSNPAYPEDEILSRILFGKTATELSPLEAVELGTALATLARGGGKPGALAKMRGKLNIDRLSLGSGPDGATVTGGKYLGQNVYLEVTTEPATGLSDAALEWSLSRSLSLLGQFGGDGDSGLGLRWSHDY